MYMSVRVNIKNPMQYAFMTILFNSDICNYGPPMWKNVMWMHLADIHLLAVRLSYNNL